MGAPEFFMLNFFACFSLHLKKCWELRNIYHHHSGSKKRKSSEANSGSIHAYGRYENAVKTGKTISTIAILWPVKAIFEKRAATVEVDTLISPEVAHACFSDLLSILLMLSLSLPHGHDFVLSSRLLSPSFAHRYARISGQMLPSPRTDHPLHVLLFPTNF